MLTREEALNLISDVEKFYCESADEYGYYCYEAESVIDKIYDSFEEAMKPKSCDSCRSKSCSVKRILLERGEINTSYFYCNDYEPKDTQ